jgi:uncharacterized protein YegP (UPF0339 family)
MSGQFEVFQSPDGDYRFRLLDSSGNTWATSATFPTIPAVAAAITLVREIAGTGLIRDNSTDHSDEPSQPKSVPHRPQRYTTPATGYRQRRTAPVCPPGSAPRPADNSKAAGYGQTLGRPMPQG